MTSARPPPAEAGGRLRGAARHQFEGFRYSLATEGTPGVLFGFGTGGAALESPGLWPAAAAPHPRNDSERGAGTPSHPAAHLLTFLTVQLGLPACKAPFRWHVCIWTCLGRRRRIFLSSPQILQNLDAGWPMPPFLLVPMLLPARKGPFHRRICIWTRSRRRARIFPHALQALQDLTDVGPSPPVQADAAEAERDERPEAALRSGGEELAPHDFDDVQFLFVGPRLNEAGEMSICVRLTLLAGPISGRGICAGARGPTMMRESNRKETNLEKLSGPGTQGGSSMMHQKGHRRRCVLAAILPLHANGK